MPRLFALIAATVLIVANSTDVSASTVTVPNDFPTIQSAIDSGADTVLVSGGPYGETPVVRRHIVLSARPDTQGGVVQLDGLILAPIRSENDDMYVDGFHLLNPLWIDNPEVYNRVVIENCRLDVGLLNLGGFVETGDIVVRRCTSLGTLQLYVRDDAVVESTTVMRGIDVRAHNLSVTATHVEHPGGYGIYARGIGSSVALSNNSLRNCNIAISATSEDRVEVRDNTIEDCPASAIGVNGERVTIVRNAIRRCGWGISGTGDPLVVQGNSVHSCDVGVVGRGPDFSIENNIVAYSALRGILAGQVEADRVIITGNSVVLGADIGIEVKGSLDRSVSVVEVSRNVAYRNIGPGMLWRIADADHFAPECNNWFGNSGGDVVGRDPGATDLSVDPLFCNAEGADFSLRDDSPLLDAAGCGLIGALGLGCGATPALVALLRADPTEDGIRIEWQWGGLDRPADFWIERADQASGPWAWIETDRLAEREVATDWDRQVEAGRTYYYRLAWVTTDNERGASVTISATAPRAAQLALRSIVPNPSNGRVEVSWSLPQAGQIYLAIFDVAGREVARLANGHVAAGDHTVTWSGTAPPGLYLVRLRQDGREATQRVFLRR